MQRSLRLLLLGASIAFSAPAHAQSCDGAATVGSGGTAAVSGTSASTVGTGGACASEDGTSTSIGSGGAAATAEGTANSRTKVNDNPNKLKADSRASALDQGTFSKSRTKTTVGDDGQLESKTRTMSHEPGSGVEHQSTSAQSEVPQAGTGTAAGCGTGTTPC